MDSIPYDQILLFGVLILLSGYFSASEAALRSVNRIRLRNQAENNDARARRSLRLIENVDQNLSAIQMGNNIVKIVLAVLVTKAAMDMFNATGATLLISACLVIVVLLIFGEVLSKSLAKRYAGRFLLSISFSLEWMLKLLYPVTWIFITLKESIHRWLGPVQEEPSVTEEDVKALVQIGEEEGIFLAEEKALVHSVLNFDTIIVNDILTPRPDVVAVSINSSLEEVKDTFIQKQYSRLPVYDGSIDNVVGIISYRDFFSSYVKQNLTKIEEIIRKPYFVVGSMKISDLLKELQQSKVHLAIVLDEYGGTAGIISIEDIIEEIVGEIWDEHDENETLIEPINHNRLRLDGRISINQMGEYLNINLPETVSNTLSGWISETLGYLPKKGEVLEHHHYKFTIEEVKNRRIQKVIVETLHEAVQTA